MYELIGAVLRSRLASGLAMSAEPGTVDLFSPEKLASMLVTALATIVNLLIMYVILKRFLFKPILNAMHKRQESIAAETQQAEAARAEAVKREAEARQTLEQAVTQAATIVHDAREQAQSESQTIVAEARTNARNLQSRAEEEQERLRAALLNDVRSEIADLAVSIASQVIGQQMNETNQRRLVESILDSQLGQPAAASGSETGQPDGNSSEAS